LFFFFKKNLKKIFFVKKKKKRRLFFTSLCKIEATKGSLLFRWNVESCIVFFSAIASSSAWLRRWWLWVKLWDLLCNLWANPLKGFGLRKVGSMTYTSTPINRFQRLIWNKYSHIFHFLINNLCGTLIITLQFRMSRKIIKCICVAENDYRWNLKQNVIF